MAQNVSIEIRPGDDVDLVEVLNRYPATPEAGGVQLALGDAYGGERRAVVFALHVPALAELGMAKVADVVLRYVGVGDQIAAHELTLPLLVNVVSAAEAASAQADHAVVEEVVVLEAAKARDEARPGVDHRRLDIRRHYWTRPPRTTAGGKLVDVRPLSPPSRDGLREAVPPEVCSGSPFVFPAGSQSCGLLSRLRCMRQLHESTTLGTMAGEALLLERAARRRHHTGRPSLPVAANATVPVDVFDAAYAGTEPFMGIHEEGRPPWEIGGPQPAVVALAEAGLITGRVLDVGCGTGENALYLAARGIEVVGVDASGVGIDKARAKAQQRDLACQFLVADALELGSWDERFDTVVDAGLLHLFAKADCARLVRGLHQVLRPGGRHHLVCFNHRKPPPAPRRLSRHDIAATFRHGWKLERVVECRYEVLDGLEGPNAWQASLVRL